MSTGTSLVTFKQGLKTALAARPGLSGVQVVYEFPETGLQRDAIWFENAETDDEIVVMRAGTKKVDETYDLQVIVQSLKPDGDGQEAADLRAAALLAELQQALAESPQLVPEIQWAELVGWNHTVGTVGGSGNGSRFLVTLRVRARLEP